MVVHPELRTEANRLYRAWLQDSNSDAGREFEAFRDAMTALRDGYENDYIGKRLGRGSTSHDLRDAAELKVEVFDEGGTRERPRPSHRMVYREFDPPPKIENGRVVPDPDALPVRQIIAFNHRSTDPAAIAGERLGRARGKAEESLHGLIGGGRPSVGPQRQGEPTTPIRGTLPQDVLQQILRDSPPAGTAPRSPAAPGARVRRAGGPGAAESKER